MNEIDEKFTPIQPINSPWLDLLLQSVAQVKHGLLIVSPFIKKEAISYVEEILIKNADERLESLNVRVITCTRENDLLAGASDIEALQRLLDWPEIISNSTLEMRSIENLHAKLWVVDDRLAIVGSANATYPGLQNNIEYGLMVTDSKIVELILEDWLQWWDKASAVDKEQLQRMHQWLRNMKTNKLWRETEEIAVNRRKAIEEEIGKPPRIGKRVSLPRKKKTSLFREPELVSPISVEEQAADVTEESRKTPTFSEPIHFSDIHQPSLFELPEDLTKTSVETTIQTFMVSAFQFEQAFKWVCPIVYRSEEEPTDGTFSIKCLPASSQLYLTWSDDMRHSQAALTCLNMNLKGEMSFTYGWRSVRSIAENLMNIYTIRTRSYPYKNFNLLFSLDEATRNLTMQGLAIDANSKDSNSSALIPVSAPLLKSPVTDITVKASSIERALGRMERVWKRRFPTLEFPNIVEVRLEPHGDTSAMKLIVGSPDNLQEKTVWVENQSVSDPLIPIRWNLFTLREILMSNRQTIAGNVLSRMWQISISSDANFVLFVPKPNEIVQWYHRLKSEAKQEITTK